jgi:hypothetical protein
MRFVLMLLAAALLAVPTSASANTVAFGDTTIFWDGYSSPAGNSENNKDSMGNTPNFSGGRINFTASNAIDSIEFDYIVGNKNLFENIGAQAGDPQQVNSGDLYLDLDNDKVWDYFVDVNGRNGTYNLYAANIALGDVSKYIVSFDGGNPQRIFTTQPNNIRCAHPVDVFDPTSYMQVAGASVSLSGYTKHGGTLLFDFSGTPITLGAEQKLSIGYTVNCANDVIYETICAPVPVPGAVWLLGLGLSGLFGVRKLRR